MRATMEEMTYEWPPHVGQYDAKIFGFTIVEAVAALMSFLVVMATFSNLFVGLLVGVLALLFVRRLERLGGVSLPVYIFYRVKAAYSSEIMELPLITAQSHQGVVEIEDWEGGTVAVIE
jgi:hypothetical protein